MTQYLPPTLLNFFQPGPPVFPLPQPEPQPHERTYPQPLTGIASLVKEFGEQTETKPPFIVETRNQRRQRKAQARQEKHQEKLQEAISSWKPSENEEATKDAYKTLFVGRLSYNVTESELTETFEKYGPVKKVVIVKDRETGKPKGYAFVEFEHERDLKDAYKQSDGRKIDGRRIVVDVERGRTVDDWKPRRLGGGLGGSRIGGEKDNHKYSGRFDPRRGGREEKREERRGGRDGRDQRGDRRDGRGGYDRGDRRGGYDRGDRRGGYDRGDRRDRRDDRRNDRRDDRRGDRRDDYRSRSDRDRSRRDRSRERDRYDRGDRDRGDRRGNNPNHEPLGRDRRY